MRSWKLGVAFLQVWPHLMPTSKTCPALRLISILYLVRGRGVRASWPIFPRNFSFKICDVSGYGTELQNCRIAGLHNGGFQAHRCPFT